MREVHDSAEWAALLPPSASVLQTFAWGKLKSRWGWRPYRLVWDDTSSPVLAQVLIRRLSLTGLTFAYVPHGPIVPSGDSADWRRVLEELPNWAAQQSSAVVKVELDVDADAAPVLDALAAADWRRSHEAIQFRNTMLTDLTPAADDLLAAMKSKTRYNIRLAERRGLTAHRFGREALPTLYSLYRETGARDGFAVREEAYYHDAWTTLIREQGAQVIAAVRGSDLLAANLIVPVGTTAYYMYGASSTEGRRDMPAYLAQWESLLWAKEVGCKSYDWWGGPTTMDEADPLWGVHRFKSGFGAELRPRLGAWDFAVLRSAYTVYLLLTGLRRRLLHMRSTR